jgi:futalosine hydrolase
MCKGFAMDKGDILIAAAVVGELEDLQKSLTGAAEQRIGEQCVTSGRSGQQAVRLVITGPGTANTVHGLTIAIAAKRPALILQTGCGGGFGEAGIKNGDVAVASEEIDVHLGLEPDGPEDAIGALDFPMIKKPGREIFNCYPVDAREHGRAVKGLKAALAGSGVNVFSGPFITVATVTASVTRARHLHQHHGALVENMEGAGAAHVAALYEIPFIEIRAVSNQVGDRDKNRWDLPLAFKNCAQAVRVYLENR